jgi:hypothetical protein
MTQMSKTQMTTQNFSKAELLVIVKDHALLNYEKGGWDYLIECHDDAEILKAMGRSVKAAGAIWAVQTNLGLKLQDEARSSAQAEARGDEHMGQGAW